MVTANQNLETDTRIQSVDVLRGLVMILMAIDHVRVYSGIPPGGPDPAIFFTRWITHYCAPAFAFFAGTSAFLYGLKLNDKGKLSRYLIVRGLLLIVLELTLIRFLWAFNIGSGFILMGVIWMLGACMVLLAGLIWLSPRVVGIIGLLIIFFQPVFALVPNALPESARASFGKFWEFIYPAGLETFNGVSILYVIVPWIGVMAAGYGFGLILKMEAAQRNKYCLLIGGGSLALFLVIGVIQVMMKEPGDESMPFILQLLNQRKYPASPLFLMMTLGPVILMIPAVERLRIAATRVFAVIGRVPMFYYLLHILIIHLSALVVQVIVDGSVHQDWFNYAPFTSVPEESRWSLPVLYFVFFVDVAILYVICKWYDGYKSSHRGNKLLKYL